MMTEKFLEVLQQEGVVSIISWGEGEPHVVNTWNSYIHVTEDGRLLIPAAGMRRTQKNVDFNEKVKLTIGSKTVMGYNYPGTGFLIEGTAKFVESGAEFDHMKAQFSFLSRVLEITVTSAKQTL